MDNETKLEAIYKKVNNFDHREFLEGAKKAFEIIISSFNNGDKKTLKNLVSKDVYSTFEKAIDEKTNNPESQFSSQSSFSISDHSHDLSHGRAPELVLVLNLLLL